MREMTAREREGVLFGAGAGLTLIVLLVLQPFIGSGLLSTRTVTVTVTTSDACEQVANAYANHLKQLSARNIPALLSGYESNATIEWTGATEAGIGNFSGSTDIDILLTSFFATTKFINFSLSNEYQAIGVKGTAWVVNSTFNFQGYNPVVGKVNGTIVAQDVYEHVGDSSWLIVRETWNYTQFNEQYYVGE